MKKIKYIVLLFFLLPFIGQAQFHEVGAGVGVANYRGELAPVVNLTNPRLHIGAFYRANINKFLSIRVNLSYSRIAQDDANSNDRFAQIRNHNFRTILLEGSVQAEYNFFDFRAGSKKIPQNWTPYIFAGVGVNKFDPLENLQPTYTALTVVIPVGVGFKAVLTDRINLGVDFGPRFTFTDLLDDLGTNVNRSTTNTLDPKYYTGNPNDKDMYFFTSVNISYVFPVIGKDCPVKIPYIK